MHFSFRFVNLIPNEWSFVLSCIVLRLLEGLGTAVLNTAIFSTFPKLFPKSVATLVVTQQKVQHLIRVHNLIILSKLGIHCGEPSVRFST